MDDAQRQTILRVHIDTDREVLGRDAGFIFDRLANGFEIFQRLSPPGEPRAQLRLHRLEVGSLVADLLAVAAHVVTLHDFWEVATRYVSNISDTLDAILSGKVKRREDIAPADRTLIEALANPVANDSARQTSVQVIGDNNNIVIINQANADQVMEWLLRTAPKRANRDAPETEVAAVEYEALEPQRPKIETALPRLLKESPSARLISASLVPVGSKWMARPEGMGGALFNLGVNPLAQRLSRPTPKAPSRTCDGVLSDNRFYVRAIND